MPELTASEAEYVGELSVTSRSASKKKKAGEVQGIQYTGNQKQMVMSRHGEVRVYPIWRGITGKAK